MPDLDEFGRITKPTVEEEQARQRRIHIGERDTDFSGMYSGENILNVQDLFVSTHIKNAIANLFDVIEEDDQERIHKGNNFEPKAYEALEKLAHTCGERRNISFFKTLLDRKELNKGIRVRDVHYSDAGFVGIQFEEDTSIVFQLPDTNAPFRPYMQFGGEGEIYIRDFDHPNDFRDKRLDSSPGSAPQTRKFFRYLDSKIPEYPDQASLSLSKEAEDDGFRFKEIKEVPGKYEIKMPTLPPRIFWPGLRTSHLGTPVIGYFTKLKYDPTKKTLKVETSQGELGSLAIDEETTTLNETCVGPDGIGTHSQQYVKEREFIDHVIDLDSNMEWRKAFMKYLPDLKKIVVFNKNDEPVYVEDCNLPEGVEIKELPGQNTSLLGVFGPGFKDSFGGPEIYPHFSIGVNPAAVGKDDDRLVKYNGRQYSVNCGKRYSSNATSVESLIKNMLVTERRN
tara:strand:+ start:41 stop:1396 length:1356 start_codon:yes stop_codon:yes gene_type:complete